MRAKLQTSSFKLQRNFNVQGPIIHLWRANKHNGPRLSSAAAASCAEYGREKIETRNPIFVASDAKACSKRTLKFEYWSFPEACGLKLEVSAVQRDQEAAA
jgi:hypothetical protein